MTTVLRTAARKFHDGVRESLFFSSQRWRFPEQGISDNRQIPGPHRQGATCVLVFCVFVLPILASVAYCTSASVECNLSEIPSLRSAALTIRKFARNGTGGGGG